MSKNKQDITLQCKPMSTGIAIGKAFIYRDILTRDISSYNISEKNVTHELRRITKALSSVKRDLYKLSRSVSHSMSSKEGSIFEAQRLMLDDNEFTGLFETEMRNELTNAEQVTKNVFRKYINRFENLENEIIKSKTEDLHDILRKMLRHLLGIDTNILARLPENSIIISRRLLPSDTIILDRNHVKGIIVEEGSIHAHSAIIARSLGIPALVTNEKILQEIQDRTTVIIDGFSGKAIINPLYSTAGIYRNRQSAIGNELSKKIRSVKGYAKTVSGRTIKLMANANTLQEVQNAKECGCDGIGLFRTEGIYLQHKSLPDEEELYVHLKNALEPAGNIPITVRVLDIGGDKRLPYFQLNNEVSPFLGLRGIRLLLRNPALLKTQINVLLKLHQEFNLRVLLPMVTLPEEVSAVYNMIEGCQKDLKHILKKKNIRLGCMIETPASALAIDEFLQVSDFISIGTNDLIQYVMAASRENPDVADYYEKGIDYILPLIKNIANACKKAGKECSVCGEIVNEEHCLKKFMDCGIDQFSISAFRIPHLKAYIRELK